MKRRASTDRSTTRVFLVGEQRLVIDALRMSLSSHQLTVHSATGAETAEVLESVISTKPDLVIMGDRGAFQDREELISSIRGTGTHAVVLCSWSRNPSGEQISKSEQISKARFVLAGASALFDISDGHEALLDIILSLRNGVTIITDHVRYTAEAMVRDYDQAEKARQLVLERLTEREKRILREIAAGRSAMEIADRSFTSINTVRSHIRAVLMKLGVKSQLAAVAMAHENGWTGPQDVPAYSTSPNYSV